MVPEYPANRLLAQLDSQNLLPAILFRTSRKQCDGDILRLERSRSAQLEETEQMQIKSQVDEIVAAYGIERAVIEGHSHYEALIRTGAGAHHAGQLLVWRLLLEELMTRSALRLMVATGTVAAGVDFPARTVVITAHSKRGAEGFRHLSASEFQQMSGRAGRRGKDAVGFCIVAPGPFSDARVIFEVARQPPEPLRSAYFAAPSTVLNLLKFRNVDDLKYTVGRSLASFHDRKLAEHLRLEASQLEGELTSGSTYASGTEHRKKAEKRVRRRQREADEIEAKQSLDLEKMLEGLEKLGYMESGALTEKGLWAAHLCTNLVLELGEALSDFLFDDISLEELVGLVASIAGDPHRVYVSIRQNPIKQEYFQRLEGIVQRVRSAFVTPPNTEIQVLPDAAVTVISWMEAESWTAYSGILRLAGVAEGDAARLIMQTGEHLGQMARLFETHPSIARLAGEGKRLLLKPPLSDALVD